MTELERLNAKLVEAKAERRALSERGERGSDAWHAAHSKVEQLKAEIYGIERFEADEALRAAEPVTTVDQVIAEIAKTKIGLASLEERGNDRDDFADLSIWQVRQALELAFAAGRDFETKRQK